MIERESQLVTIMVTNVLFDTKTAFALREDNGEQVIIAPSVSRAVGLEAGDIVSALIVPNVNPPQRDPSRPPVPWFARTVARVAQDLMTPQEVYDALEANEYPMTAEEAGLPLIALQQAYQHGRVVKVIVKEKPNAQPVIMWCNSMDKL
jgi:hypothetical protein